VGTAALDRWVRSFAVLVTENKDLLTDLDAAIGDGDHGTNMDRGMQAVVAALDDTPPVTASALLNKVGMTLVSTVGGASGPLFGTFFLRVGASLGDTAEISLAQLAAALRAGLEGIVARGKAEAGDKTIYDALAPAVNALDSAVSEGDARAEGPGQLPGRAKRRAPRPRRHHGRAAHGRGDPSIAVIRRRTGRNGSDEGSRGSADGNT
jgi:dihydroxyacetone kinase-like protein